MLDVAKLLKEKKILNKKTKLNQDDNDDKIFELNKEAKI